MTATFELYRDDLRPLIVRYLIEHLKVEITEEHIESIETETDEPFECLLVRIDTNA